MGRTTVFLCWDCISDILHSPSLNDGGLDVDALLTYVSDQIASNKGPNDGLKQEELF